MTIQECIEKFKTNENLWSVRKDWLYDRADLIRSFGKIGGETEEEWLMPCWHEINEPATPSEIAQVQNKLGYELPEDLRQFLTIANGARLYCLKPLWMLPFFPAAKYQRYRILGTAELISVNRDLLAWFLSAPGDDSSFRDYHNLNYVAFCDAFDGDYLAILLTGSKKGQVFFLDHECLSRPYSEKYSDVYFDAAQSMKAWLELLVRTKGWGGFGETPPPL